MARLIIPKNPRTLVHGDNGVRNAETLRHLINDISIFLEGVNPSLAEAEYLAYFNSSNKDIIESASNNIMRAEHLKPVLGKWNCLEMIPGYDNKEKASYFKLHFKYGARKRKKD